MKPLLDVQNLQVRFLQGEDEQAAVKGISFSISKGSIVGIVGESGSGKSVSTLAVMRLLPKAPNCKVSGIIRFFENEKAVELSQLAEEGMRKFRGRKISMIFQEPMSSLNPVLTCGEQLAEMLCLHLKVSRSGAKRQTIDYFQKVKLPNPEHIFSSYPHQLSGGQKQRVMIAMAICCHPDLIIADEPTTALDVTVQKEILNLLKELRKDLHAGILFITHDLGVVREIADEVLVMYNGEIVERGAAQSLFINPQHPYTKGLLASRPSPNRKLKRLPTMTDFIRIDHGKITAKETDIEVLLKSLEQDKGEKSISEADKNILEVRDLTVMYPGKRNFLGKVSNWTHAVDKVSFNVKKGETLGLAGESGCGKSTLSRAILQLIKIPSGEVWFEGQNLCALSPKEMRKIRSRIQLIFQDPYSSLNPRLTIGEAILEPMRWHKKGKNNKERKQKAEELLEKVGLHPGIIHHYPHEFSGGQRQRISIARTLALEPDFIICDESVSALDVSVQAQVLNLLLALKKEFGFSCIFISHDLSVVKFMSDRIMIMNKGKLEEIDTAEHIFDQPKSAYTRQLLAAIPK